MPAAPASAVDVDSAASDEKSASSGDRYNIGEYDEWRTKFWDNKLDHLALFAAFLSAMASAFIIETQKDMEPDYAKLTFLVLNASAHGEKFVAPWDLVPLRDRAANSLWVASLVFSLSAALLDIVGKNWIAICSLRPVCSPRQCAEMSAYRIICVERWYATSVIFAAPALLHASLLLFVTGLVLFTSTHHLALGLCMTAGTLYPAATFGVMVSPASLFKSHARQTLRFARAVLLYYMCGVGYRPKPGLARTVVETINAVPFSGVGSTVTTLPLHAYPGVQHQHTVLPSMETVVRISRTMLGFVSSLPESLRTVRRHFRWSVVKLRLGVASSVACGLQGGEWFGSSADLLEDDQPELCAVPNFLQRNAHGNLHLNSGDPTLAHEPFSAHTSPEGEHIDSLKANLQVAINKSVVDIVFPHQIPIRGGGGNVMQGYGQINGVKRDFAVKFCRDRQVMPRECEIWKSLSHDNILPLCCSIEFQAAWPPGSTERVLVSPYLEQGNLVNYLGSKPLAPRLPLMIDVATGLAYLHDTMGLVHGDIKAENILIRDNGRAVLADFGLSTSVAAGRLETAENVRQKSTILYCAPEIVDDEARDPSALEFKRSKTRMSDMYAYGVLLYYTYGGELGEKPSDRIRLMGDMFKGLLPPRPISHFPVLCDDIWSICERCWTIEAAKRPPVADVLENLRDLELSRGSGEGSASESIAA